LSEDFKNNKKEKTKPEVSLINIFSLLIMPYSNKFNKPKTYIIYFSD